MKYFHLILLIKISNKQLLVSYSIYLFLKIYHPLKNIFLVKVVEQLYVLGIYVLYAYH